MKSRKFFPLFIGVMILLTGIFALAAGDSWVVVKDKDNVPKVVQSAEKTANTVAGPFTSKELADEALAKIYPKSATERLKEKASEGIEKVKSEAAKLKAEAEKLKEKASPGIEKAKSEAEKLKEKAEQGIDKARDMIQDYLPKK
ncbi:MAG: hypothetical protein ACP5U1_03200 [Desulfomonilaceae bacterium]